MIRFYLSDNENERMVLKALYDGCPEEKTLVEGFEYQPSDVAVVFGVYKKQIPISFPRGRVIAKQQIRGLKNLIVETGYINRGTGEDKYYAVGWNGLNGRADFKNKGMPPDRAKKLPVEMKPWRTEGNHIVLCGQVPWDASVDHTNHVQWLIETAAVLQMMTKRLILFRPHPLSGLPNITDCMYSASARIEDDLDGAHCCVTFNSNSGVDAVMNGIPVWSFDIGSMVYPISNKLWTDLEKPKMPDRTQWLADLAYAQWRPDELRSGEAWQHLTR